MHDQRKTEQKESWGGLFMHVYVGIYYKESDDYLEYMKRMDFFLRTHACVYAIESREELCLNL
jgi:uncharacterized protein (DUF1919 family)